MHSRRSGRSRRSGIDGGTRRASAPVAAILGVATAVLALGSPAASAACRHWDLGGKWSFTQSNGYIGEFDIRQDGNRLSGKAQAHRPGDQAVRPDSLNGSIDGSAFSFTVDWVYLELNHRSLGVYQGTIGGDGRVTGKTHDKNHPLVEGSHAKWRGNRAAVCLDAQDEAAADPAQPVVRLGKVKPVLELGRVRPVLQLGKVKPSAPNLSPICDAARSARKRNSPAAPGLEAQCRAYEAANPPVQAPPTPVGNDDVADLATEGKALARRDRRAAELRNRQGRGAGQLGFDVGMAVASTDTLPGPGKDNIGNALSVAERQGFDVAVAYSLERNRNAKLAAVGAEIAERDREVAGARTAERDVFYWLGFDIGTGIFGDPKRGARGNTATGPGSLKVRDALSPAGQRGFNAAVAFHLNRRY